MSLKFQVENTEEGLEENVEEEAYNEDIIVSTIDNDIHETLRDIEEIDVFLRKLNDKKLLLLAKYDKLKEQRMLKKSEALSNKDWDGGKFILIVDILFTTFL